MNDGEEFSSGGDIKPCHIHACLPAAMLLRFLFLADQNPAKEGRDR
jgi:hypothetical protein